MPLSVSHNLITNDGIHDLATQPLSFEEKSVLARGLKFIPTPSARPRYPFLNLHPILHGALDFFRSVRLGYTFRLSSKQVPKIYVKKPHYRPHSTAAIDQWVDQTTHRLQEVIATHQTPRHFFRNLSKPEQTALQQLREDETRIIKPADKNAGVCVMDRQWYKQECLRQLGDHSVYEPVASVDHGVIWSELETLIQPLNKMDQEFILLDKNQTRVPQFYVLPKLHKPPPLTGRPIVASVKWITTQASKWLDVHLQPIVAQLPNILKNSQSLISHLEQSRWPLSTTSPVHLFTADVTSLYTNIPHREGCRAIDKAIDLYSDEKPAVKRVMKRLCRFVLKHNYFEFDSQLYHQVAGTAMGTNMAPAYANIFMHFLETQFIDWAMDAAFDNGKNEPYFLCWCRYIDDIFGVATVNQEELVPVIQSFFTQHNLQLSVTVSTQKVEFLDLVISKGPRYAAEGRLDLSVHQKALNSYQYIPHRSFHHPAMFKGWIRAELIRYLRNTSSFADFVAIKQLFFQRLRARGYPVKLLLPLFNDSRLLFTNRALYLCSANRKEVELPYPLVVEFTPRTSRVPIGAALHTFSLPAEVPKRRIVVAHKRARNLHDILVRAKF